ncbi:PfkB family carbohydrate kinase [Actinomadura madurae]|uniref:PfkB family carbohydrate kinase n=1 Tax=Actinomadura madurae TaxID=1993 RepID=UPI003555CFA3
MGAADPKDRVERAGCRRSVGLGITTLSSKGCLLIDQKGTEIYVDPVPAREVVDPTGVGDRSCRLPGRGERRTRPGTRGPARFADRHAGDRDVDTQEWRLDPVSALTRLSDAYGPVPRPTSRPSSARP